MVNPDSALRRLLRDTGKLLEPHGFHGSEPIWVRVEPGGLASVSRTRVSRTWSAGQQVLAFGLQLNATPTPWWEFCNWRNTQLDLPPTPLEKATGPDLIDTHGLPDDLTTMWTLRLDPAEPGQVRQADIDTIRAQLPRRVHTHARRALQLCQPNRYLDELLTHPTPAGRTREAIVVLLADRGPGPQLDEAIHHLRESFATRDASPYAEEVITYAQTRAALV